MRFFALGLTALILGACGQALDNDLAASSCTYSATHEVIWTNSNAADTITTHSEGPSCAQAIVTFTARNAQGDPLWAFASSYYAMNVGEGAPPEGAPPVSNQDIEHFLAAWAEVTQMRSSQLPQWRDIAHTDAADGLSYASPLNSESYPLVRERDLPLICLAVGAEASQCLMIDPFSHAPALLVTVGP